MTPEQAAERIVGGVEREYVKGLLDYVLANMGFLTSEPDYQLLYKVMRLYDVMPGAMVDMYLKDRARILAAAEKVLDETAWDAGTEKALRDYTGVAPSMMYAYHYQRTHDETVQGCLEILNRQNVALANGMAERWYEVSMRAVTQMVTFSKGPSEIIREAVSGMRGITNVVYESVARYPVDAAIRRHIETQLNQNHQRLNELRAAEYGWDLFMCSAHPDCRPSHYDLQGRIYSQGEAIGETVDGEEVLDYEQMGIGEVDGIYGANCRHYVTPFVPGYSELQRPPYGEEMNEERYDLTQKQRARERRVRADKLELYEAEKLGDQDVIAQARLRVRREQASIREFCKEHELVRRYDLERAYPL